MRIRVRIGRLVAVGTATSSRDHDQIVQAIETELSKSFSGAPPVAPVRLGASSKGLGEQIGRSVSHVVRQSRGFDTAVQGVVRRPVMEPDSGRR
jgi:hypothetical protein